MWLGTGDADSRDNVIRCHPRENGDLFFVKIIIDSWIPAFLAELDLASRDAGMTSKMKGNIP